MGNNLKIAVILTAFDKMSAIINSAVSKSQQKLTVFNEKANAFANKSFKSGRDMAAMGMAAGLALAAPIKQAMDFEKRMVDIRKQMQTDTPNFVKQMTDDVFMLGKQLPIATGDIQDMIASSLRMGVAQNQVINFTKDVTKMSVAFDMVPAEIADSMGKIANVFNIPIQKIGNFADVINYLDDNTMAKGPELIDVLQRIGGTSKYFDPKSAAALASTMLSLGESSETSGSGINAMINKLGAAKMGSAKFQKGLEMIRLSAEDVQKRMSSKATSQGTIIDVLTRINKLDPSKQNEALVRLFGLEHGPKLAKLTNNVKEYERQLKLVQGQEKGSMDKEYSKRIQTATSQWQIFKNRLIEVSVKVGTALLPTFNKVLASVSRLADKVSDFASKNPELVTKIGKAVAAFAAFSFAGSGLSFAFGGVAKAITLVTGPVSRVIGFFTAGAGGVSSFTKVLRVLGTVGGFVGKVLVGAFNLIRGAWALLRIALMAGAGPYMLVIGLIAGAAFLIVKFWKPIKNFFIKLWDGIKTGVMAAINFLKKGFLNFTPLGLIIKHWDKLKGFFTALWDFVKSIFKLAITAIGAVLLNFTPAGLIIKHWSKITGFFGNLWSGVKTRFKSSINTLKSYLLLFTPVGLIYNAWRPLTGFFSKLWAGVKAGVKAAIDGIKNIFNEAVEWVMNLGHKFYEAGANIIKSIIDGITSKITAVTDKIKEVTQKIRDYFPFSPAKAGPLRDIHRIRLVETIAGGIRPDAMVQRMRQMVPLFIKPINTGFAPGPTTGGGGFNVTINLTVNGGATKEQADLVAKQTRQQVEDALRRYEQNQRRVKF